MSIINVVCAGPYALVAVDTEIYDVDQDRVIHGTKLFPIVHANSVLACRGNLGVPAYIANAAGLRAADFDALVRLMPELIREALCAVADAAGDDPQGAGIKPLLVGP